MSAVRRLIAHPDLPAVAVVLLVAVAFHFRGQLTAEAFAEPSAPPVVQRPASLPRRPVLPPREPTLTERPATTDPFRPRFVIVPRCDTVPPHCR
ncbi:hypothetical protein [Alienimonas californiensis]|uniref:Uncharacterized protein n=1 Tax=Alienimonas californiensis TaxID=2527989 RepID=A0A517P7C0_9PLAN|nr:hypothetical protein [Alienimonas californiensis]QDT15245.1 hypothetical protein CA12_13280 [Alienimonas californiensis]